MRKLSSEELHRTDLSEINKLTRIPVCIVLDNVRSGLNVGSIFRTADAFSFEKIVLTGITVQPPHREILKTALGSTESVPWLYIESITECLTLFIKDNYTIIAIEQTNQSILLDQFAFETDKKYALVLGNEVDGVSEEALQLIDTAIEIPQAGIKHSLNVSICGGIVMWEAFKQFSC